MGSMQSLLLSVRVFCIPPGDHCFAFYLPILKYIQHVNKRTRLYLLVLFQAILTHNVVNLKEKQYGEKTGKLVNDAAD